MNAQGCVVYRLPFTKTVSPTGSLRLWPTDRESNGVGDWKPYVSIRSHCRWHCFKYFLIITLTDDDPTLFWPHHRWHFCFSLMIDRECEFDPRPGLGESQHTLVKNRRMHVGNSYSNFAKKSKLMIFFTKFIIFIVFTGIFLIKFPYTS